MSVRRPLVGLQVVPSFVLSLLLSFVLSFYFLLSPGRSFLRHIEVTRSTLLHFAVLVARGKGLPLVVVVVVVVVVMVVVR